MKLLELSNLQKQYGENAVIHDISMDVTQGEVVAIIGPSGSGKSTLLRCAAGIYRPADGTVTMDGVPIYENPKMKARMNFIPDDLYFFLSASTRDMMQFYRGFYPNFDMKRYEALKDIFGSVNEKQPIRRLSKGMQKQSAFWLSLCCKPDYLLLDEPVDGLDPVMRRQVWSLLIGDVAEHGTTVLVSSHNLRELE
ncbi:MAG: ABC transporter ATP-binding protein, partial [Oscillospiraceae bacterium]